MTLLRTFWDAAVALDPRCGVEVIDLDSDECADLLQSSSPRTPRCGTRTSASEAQPGWPIWTRLPSGR
jgi:hypothetical protein